VSANTTDPRPAPVTELLLRDDVTGALNRVRGVRSAIRDATKKADRELLGTELVAVEFTLSAALEAITLDSEEDYPAEVLNRVEQTFIRMALQRVRHYLNREIKVYEQHRQNERAFQARGMVKSISDCLELLDRIHTGE